MRISSYCGGFILYEVMVRITAGLIISVLIAASTLPKLNLTKIVNAASC